MESRKRTKVVFSTMVLLAMISNYASAHEKLLVDEWSLTEPKTLRGSYMWKIANFSSYRKSSGEHLETPTFDALDDPSYKFSLSVYPNGVYEEKKNHLGIFLIYKSGNLPKINMNFKLSLLTSSLESVRSYEASNVPNEKNDGLGYATMYSSDLIPSTFTDDIVVVYAEFTGFIGLKNLASDCQEISLPRNQRYLLREYVDEDRYSDVTLSVKGEKIPAHKVLLASQSSVFQSMFSEETTGWLFDIVDFDSDVVKKALDYLYVGRAEDIDSLAKQLFLFASVFKIEKLKSRCEERLARLIDADNAVELLNLAEHNDAEILKSKALRFIAADINKFAEIPEFDGILENSDLHRVVVL